jgi:hypothetical protein
VQEGFSLFTGNCAWGSERAIQDNYIAELCEIGEYPPSVAHNKKPADYRGGLLSWTFKLDFWKK